MARKRKLLPEQMPDAREKLLKCYASVFSSGEGQVVLADLVAQFGRRKVTSIAQPTGDVMVNRVLVAEGARLVTLYIEEMLEEGDNGRSTAGKLTDGAAAESITDPESIWDA